MSRMVELEVIEQQALEVVKLKAELNEANHRRQKAEQNIAEETRVKIENWAECQRLKAELEEKKIELIGARSQMVEYAIERNKAEQNLQLAIGALEIKSLVDKFLAWKLPTTCRPDPYPPESPHAQHNSGTNLLTADEAKQLFEYLFGETLAQLRQSEGR